MTITRTDIIQLPFKIANWDEDGLVALSRNFTVIEEMLGSLQVYMNSVGYTTINNSGDALDKIVLCGLDADKPEKEERDGTWFYWAEDSEKLYLLREVTA